METIPKTNKSFFRNKSAEELQYAIEQYKISLISLEKELNFYEFLLDSCKFKSPVMNIFERVIQFKIEIATSNKKCNLLLNDVNSLIIKIDKAPFKKYDLIINELESLETKFHDFSSDISRLKSSMFEYLQCTIDS